MRWIIAPFLLVLVTSVPGLRKVPKVYNALITTDQNLLPSRAFPVLQPVVHKTAVGYVPPYYYTQIAPQYSPELVQISQGIAPTPDDESSKPKMQNPSESANNGNQVPLRFYPNYHSFYYDPYFYTYNGYDSHLAPSTYQENDKIQAAVDPLPPQNLYSEHLLPSLHDEKAMKNSEEKKKDIPDVPPPPVPTTASRNS